jgi:hypothetical protein
MDAPQKTTAVFTYDSFIPLLDMIPLYQRDT